MSQALSQALIDLGLMQERVDALEAQLAASRTAHDRTSERLVQITTALTEEITTRQDKLNKIRALLTKVHEPVSAEVGMGILIATIEQIVELATPHKTGG